MDHSIESMMADLTATFDDVRSLFVGDDADAQAARRIVDNNEAAVVLFADQHEHLSHAMYRVLMAHIVGMMEPVTALKSLAQVRDPRRYREVYERSQARERKARREARSSDFESRMADAGFVAVSVEDLSPHLRQMLDGLL